MPSQIHVNEPQSVMNNSDVPTPNTAARCDKDVNEFIVHITIIDPKKNQSIQTSSEGDLVKS